MIRYARKEQHTSSTYGKREEKKRSLEDEMHDCFNLDRTLVSANNKYKARFSSFFLYMYICLLHHCKGISKEIEFRCHISKILTLKHNQSNVCYVPGKARKKRNCGYKVQMYIKTKENE
jgi:hypothetical protein